MFNGYNETPLISYNEFNQEREKKQENVPKWSYGHEVGAQPAQPHANGRHSEFWSGKPNFLGIPNVLKCNCAGCYPSSESQSYQGDTTRHRPWLPRTFSVPLNGSNESCKLPTYQWDNGFSNQGPCYPEGSLPAVQETGGKYSYYRHYQNSRLPEPNQPGVIISVKNGEYSKKPKNEMPSPIQNGGRQPVLCNPACKRVDGRNYCDPNEKYSNVASYSVDQQVPRLPVVEPFIRAVPSNLSQNRVPSTGYRAVKENLPQQYISSGYGDARKVTEPSVNGEKPFPQAQLQTGLHKDYSYLNRDIPEMEPQKFFFDNTRHSDYYPKNNFQDMIKRNNQTLDGRKDCAINQIGQSGLPEQHYNLARAKETATSKPSYEVFYEKSRQESHADCFQQYEDSKTENTSVHARLPRSTLIFNDPRFVERTQNSFPYQSSQAGYGSYFRSEQQMYNAEPRYRYPSGFQRNDINQYRAVSQQVQGCEQAQQGTGFICNIYCQQNVDKTQFYGVKNPSSIQTDPEPSENGKPTHLEAIRSQEVNKNGTSKISPLRLLRKKKFINVPQEPAPVSNFDAAPGLDVRKFWSTWAEEEEENVAPTQMVVLDCQNIDPEQAKLLHLYETDPVRAVHLETGSIVIKNAGCTKEEVGQAVHLDEIKADEQKVEDVAKSGIPQQEDVEKVDDNCSAPLLGSEKKSEVIESGCVKMSPNRPFKKEKPDENRGRKKGEMMDKWTEKKFDFLKRAEESKAAEILRHEEEKKKIFETRLSLQQSLKKAERTPTAVEESLPEGICPFDEDSQSNSPGHSSTSDLPTSEYRRNKFLDFAERRIILNGKEEAEREKSEDAEEPTELDDVKKENVRPEWTQSPDKLSPVKTKIKEEPCFEMDQILRKMSEINFQNAETKSLENNTSKKPAARKWKRKKSDHQPENDDKLLVETVTKPTIKFSIQKSHDLKISFKVLDSGNQYEDLGGRDVEANGNPNEDSKNSTELITLRYKSIQRDGDRKQNLGLRKSRRAFRRKKQACRLKTPVMRFKKSREAEEEEETDPLADDIETSNIPNADEYSVSDGFQVKETVDSAKIKLTFKRHKGNFETEYKINNLEVSEVDPLSEDGERCRKKSGARKSEVFAEPGVERFKQYQERGADSGPETEKVFVQSTTEDTRNSSASHDSFIEKENHELGPSTFSEFPSDAQHAGSTPENDSPRGVDPFGEGVRDYAIEGSKSNEETNKRHQEHGEFGVNHLINCGEGKRDEFSLSGYSAFPDVNLKGSPSQRPPSPAEDLGRATDSEKEEIQEISLDFIKSTKSQEIETNHKSRKTEETENGPGAVDGEKCGLESLKKTEEASIDSRSEGGEKGEKSFEKISENWEDGEGGPNGESFKIPEDNTASPPSYFEDEKGKELTPVDQGDVQNSEEEDGILLFSPKIAEQGKDANEVGSCDIGDVPRPEPKPEVPDFDQSCASSGNQKDDSKIHFPPPEAGFLPSERPEFHSLLADDENVEAEKDSITLEKRSPHLQSEEVDRLSFNLPLENSVEDDATESNRLENADFQKSPKIQELVEAPAPEKIGFESPEISFEVDQFSSKDVSRPEDDTKAGGIPSDSFLAPGECPSKEKRDTDLEQTDPETDQPSGNDAVVELAKLEAMDSTSSQFSPTGCNVEPAEALGNDSGCAECGSTPDRAEAKLEIAAEDAKITGSPDVELEDGEVVDSSDELAECCREETQPVRRKVDFVDRDVERRHSTDSTFKKFQTWSRRKFSKAKSCLPEFKFSERQSAKEETEISVKDIPLPVGPPQLSNCLYFNDHASEIPTDSEANKERNESISFERPLASQNLSDSQSCQSPFGLNDLQNCRNPSPPVPERLGILQRTSKIKFSFSKRSKFSKLGLNKARDSKIKIAFSTGEPEKKEVEGEDFEEKKIRTFEAERPNSTPKEKKIEEVPNIPNGKEEVEDVKPGSDSEQPVELLCEGLEGTVEVMNDFIRNEFYECEDLHTPEDLPNGDDLELEKVNDDKFRNIMQNCIDNAKKFLNIGSLKLFSCSVDDLLELDCRTEGTAGESESEKSTNHISRDVLLASCDDPNDDLGFPENRQTGDLSMDFVPSFSSDVCPEILPVDNWPYLEEEVPSSPKQDESDLIPALENAIHPGRTAQELYGTETGFKNFRRRSVLSEEAFKLCSTIDARRRNTIDCFTAESFEKGLCDIKNEIMRLKRGTSEFEESLKCRLSLKKLSNGEPNSGFKNEMRKRRRRRRRRNFSEELDNAVRIKNATSIDYKSPSWQPKVMLFRISKNELRKVLKSSKSDKRFRSESSRDSPEGEISGEAESEVDRKKWKCDFDCETFYENPESGIENLPENLRERSGEGGMLIGLPPLGSSLIKGSLSSIGPNKRKKKSRFRNLHTKRKRESDTAKDTVPLEENIRDDAENLLTEMFKVCDRTHTQAKHPKERSQNRGDEEKAGKKPSEGKPENPSRSKCSETDNEDPRSCSKTKEEAKENKHREKYEKRHDHRDRRKERGEGREECKERDKHEESDSKRHGRHGHDRSRHPDRRSSTGIRQKGLERKNVERCKPADGKEEKKLKIAKERSPEPPWACEVCGFNDATERVVHIRSHPFHCQSCHLAFKTEVHFIGHLTKKHKDIRNQHHCLLCELSFDTEIQYQKHLDTREHRHLEAVEKNTINTLFTLLTGAPCPVLGIVDVKPEWLPNQAGTVHFYHQATPLSLALQYLKMRHDLSSFSTASSTHPS